MGHLGPEFALKIPGSPWLWGAGDPPSKRFFGKSPAKTKIPPLMKNLGGIPFSKNKFSAKKEFGENYQEIIP